MTQTTDPKSAEHRFDEATAFEIDDADIEAAARGFCPTMRLLTRQTGRLCSSSID
jgi:hypothetical protein